MIAQYGIHRVAFFYAGVYALAVVVAKLAELPNLMTQHPLSPTDALLRVGAGLAVGAVLAAAWNLVGRVSQTVQTVDRLLAGVVGPLSLSDALILAVLSGLAEEVLFRGAIQATAGLLPASLLFAVAHLPPHKDLWPWTVMAGVLGLGLGIVTLLSGDVLFAIGVHTALNAINLRRLGAMATEETAPKEM